MHLWKTPSMANSTYGELHPWTIPTIRAPTTETTYKGFAKYAVDANLFRLGSSILRHAGPRGAAPVGDMGSEAPHKNKNKLANWIKFWDKIFFFKSGQIYMMDAECVESNEKLIFRFLVF